MRRVWLPSLWPLWDYQGEQHNSEMKSDGTVHLMTHCLTLKHVFQKRHITILPPQLPGGATGQHDPGTKHCQECCPPRECFHDGDLY